MAIDVGCLRVPGYVYRLCEEIMGTARTLRIYEERMDDGKDGNGWVTSRGLGEGQRLETGRNLGGRGV